MRARSAASSARGASRRAGTVLSHGGAGSSASHRPRVWVRFDCPVVTVDGLLPPQSDVKALFYGAA